MSTTSDPDHLAPPPAAIVVALDDGALADTDSRTPENILVVVDERRYVLTLFISGASLRSGRAVEDATALCELHVKGRYDLAILDLHAHPDAVRAHRVVGSPTLIKHLPLPEERYVGDLSQGARVLLAIQLQDSRREPEVGG